MKRATVCNVQPKKIAPLLDTSVTPIQVAVSHAEQVIIVPPMKRAYWVNAKPNAVAEVIAKR